MSRTPARTVGRLSERSQERLRRESWRRTVDGHRIEEQGRLMHNNARKRMPSSKHVRSGEHTPPTQTKKGRSSQEINPEHCQSSNPGIQIPRTGLTANILQLQRSIGNKAVANLLAGKMRKNADREKPRQVASITGLPPALKAGLETLSKLDMSDVRVHFDCGKPAQVNAYACTAGTDIFIGTGNKKYLPHEAWHVVQQKQGKVKPTTRANGIAVNDDQILEKEADVLGKKAASATKIPEDENAIRPGARISTHNAPVLQRIKRVQAMDCWISIW